jgi:hypothetical protein
MRIGIDAHILSPEHHKHHPEIAEYTRYLLNALLEEDKENSYVIFVDSRLPKDELEKLKRENTEIRYFPFNQYRAYLPFFYSHMLVSSILTAARLDLFHSPEGLIPYLYPGKVVATFHWVPIGQRDSNIFVNTWMLGARVGFSALCRKASHIILRTSKDRDILCGIHKYPENRAHVIVCADCKTVDWKEHAKEVVDIYKSTRKEKIIKPEVVKEKGKEKPSLAQRFALFKTKKKEAEKK